MTSAAVRQHLADALNLDLIGPGPDSDLADEKLPEPPSQWYLTGFLVPIDADETQKSAADADDEMDEASDPGTGDDSASPEKPAARKAFFPSSIGVSLLVPKEAKTVNVVATWGDYKPVTTTGIDGDPEAKVTHWQRTPQCRELTLPLPPTQKPQGYALPDSNGLSVAVTVRSVKDAAAFGGQIPKGCRAVSVFLVNRRPPQPDATRDEGFVFQAALELKGDSPFVARPNLRGLNSDEWDELVADIQYRDAFEYAVGHAVSTEADLTDGQCLVVRTRWLPRAEVERVAPAAIDVTLGMEDLATLTYGADAQARLSALVAGYRTWIEGQKAAVPEKPDRRRKTGDELLARARKAADRVEAGINLLADPIALEAFRLANKVMARAARQRRGFTDGVPPDQVSPPKWRPFQLAFVLMNLPAVHDPAHPDRQSVDLLFFPTGGGKTEAYLGLAAFTLVYRRLKNAGRTSGGLSVLMRYTLRLLTLDQLGRASTLICALELERQADVEKLGDWPFEIGLWVGRGATPNVMGQRGDSGAETARSRTIAYQNGKTKAPPVPIESCPWCGTKFEKTSFLLLPNKDEPTDLRIVCRNVQCPFIRNNRLPVLTVDEPIYRRLPCFLIATVDKFAALPWTGQVGGFCGNADRHDKNGFYGPCDPGVGLPLPGGRLPPPDLVIQDELHLISGPMGTMVGLYEAALDELCSRDVGGKKVRPKVIASTATVRRADRQVRALFGRTAVDIFPPPGPDRRDSFFARTEAVAESPARMYVGVAAQGRSLKVVLLRVYLALLGAAQKQYLAAGGKRAQPNPADPYMTLLGYFNSLRELGGSRRIIEDEIISRLDKYGSRKRLGRPAGDFADRKIAYEVVELTSRISTDQVAEAKRKLALPFDQDGRVDVAIATNMISVGLDISRLGLMVVFGQPKTSAEYIQASSRVGRDVAGDPAADKPGLVVTVMNVHRPRDRSHYERFGFYHATFYRSVEATSVTPFARRALDRGLAGTTVALARHGHPPLCPPRGAKAILQELSRLDFVAQALGDRAAGHDKVPAAEAEAARQAVRGRVKHLLDEWEKIAKDYADKGIDLQYQREEAAPRPLLYQFLDPELKNLHSRHQKFRANRSMRDVEASVNLFVRNFDNIEVEAPE